LITMATLAISACMTPVRSQTPKSGQPKAPPAKEAATNTPAYLPQSGDATRLRARAYVDGFFVVEHKLTLTGNLPTPCHQLRVAIPATPDAAGGLAIDAYSVSDRDSICAQVLKPFRTEVELTPQQAAATKITVNGAVSNYADR
jgi:hypothetical protein